MTKPADMTPLDAELAALITEARSGARGPNDSQRARMRARLAASVVAPVAGTAAAWSSSAAACAAPKAGIAGALAGPLAKGAVGLAAIAMATGAIVGIRQVSRSGAVADQHRVEIEQPAAPSEKATWAHERRLLQDARAALGHGRGDQALALLDEHVRRFPADLLAEEREALRVRVLVSLGRPADARAAADRFERSYPDSLHQQAVRRALLPR